MFYQLCKYADLTKFGLVCKNKKVVLSPGEKYPCPEDGGTDGKRNGICYSFCIFDKDNNDENIKSIRT